MCERNRNAKCVVFRECLGRKQFIPGIGPEVSMVCGVGVVIGGGGGGVCIREGGQLA